MHQSRSVLARRAPYCVAVKGPLMRLTHTLLAGGAAAILFAGSAFAQDDAPTADTVLAVVDGQEITLGQMIVARSQLPDPF